MLSHSHATADVKEPWKRATRHANAATRTDCKTMARSMLAEPRATLGESDYPTSSVFHQKRRSLFHSGAAQEVSRRGRGKASSLAVSSPSAILRGRPAACPAGFRRRVSDSNCVFVVTAAGPCPLAARIPLAVHGQELARPILHEGLPCYHHNRLVLDGKRRDWGGASGSAKPAATRRPLDVRQRSLQVLLRELPRS